MKREGINVKKRLGAMIAGGIVLAAIVGIAVFGFGTKVPGAKNAKLFLRNTPKIETDISEISTYGVPVLQAPDFEKLVEGEDYNNQELILLYESPEQKAAIEKKLDARGATKLKESTPGRVLIEVPDDTNVEDFYNELTTGEQVVAAQPNYIYHMLEDTPDTDIESSLPPLAPKFYVGEKPEVEAAEDTTQALNGYELEEPIYVDEYEVQDIAYPNDPYVADEWFLTRVNAYEAWARLNGFKSGKGVIVAVLDTGIDLNHPDLVNNILGGVCFTGENENGQDNEGHGTHVAGIIAAQANNGIGVSGVAPGAKLLAVKVLDRRGIGSSYNIADGIYFSAYVGADIINMSLGGLGYDAILDDAVTYAVDNGVVVVCAAGNESTSDESWPSDAEAAISVISTDIYDNKSSFSNYGEAKDIAAPGENIYSTMYSRTYAYLDGTSMACPVVAGVAALVLQADSSLSVDEVKDILYSSAKDVGYPGPDEYYGNGIVNAQKAVWLAQDTSWGDEYTLSNKKTIVSTLDSTSDSDWFVYFAESDADIRVRANGLNSLPIDVYIFDATPTDIYQVIGVIEHDCTFSPQEGRIYYIVVESMFGDIGDYDLTVYQDNVSDSAPYVALTEGKQVQSYLETDDDKDVFELKVKASTVITFDLLSLSGSTVKMDITDSLGDTIYTGTEKTEDEFTYVCMPECSLYVAISSSESFVPYQLSFQVDTNGSGFASAVSIKNYDKIEGSLETIGDADFFKFVPEANGSYYFNTLGGTDTSMVLFDENLSQLADNDDIPVPGRDGYAYLNSGIHYGIFTAHHTYYIRVRSLWGSTGDYALALCNVDPNKKITIPDKALQQFYMDYYGLPSATEVPMSVLLMTDDIQVENLINVTNIYNIRNLKSITVTNAPELTNIDIFEAFSYLKTARFERTGIKSIPDFSSSNCLEYLSVKSANVTSLPDLSSISSLKYVNVAKNYISFAPETTSRTNLYWLLDNDVIVDYEPQKVLSGVTVTATTESPKAYEDVVITGEGYVPGVDLGDNLAYLFEVSRNGVDWEIAQPWGGNTMTWYADSPGTWYIRVKSEVSGNGLLNNPSSIIKFNVKDPDPIGLGRVSLDSISASEIKPGDTVTLHPAFDLTDVPERYILQYRVRYSTDKINWTNVPNFGWTDLIGTGPETIDVEVPSATADSVYYFAVELRVNRVLDKSLIDLSNNLGVKVYTVMPLASVALTDVGNNANSQLIPSEGIVLSATAMNKAGYAETPTYQFSYRKEGSPIWNPLSSGFVEDSSVVFNPATEGVYYFKVEAKSKGRSAYTIDVKDYDYSPYTFYSTAEPVKGVYNLTADKKDYINGETVTLNMNVLRNDQNNPVEYKLLYSTNGLFYSPLTAFEPLTVAANGTASIQTTLPTVNQDTIYYLRVKVRTQGRVVGKDAIALTQVEFMTAYPVQPGEVVMTDVGDNTDNQSIGDGVLLKATQRENTEYRFLFSKQGKTNWVYVNSNWSTSNSITFKPLAGKRYRFKVEARSVNRSTTDTVSSPTDYYGLYPGTLGVRNADINFVDMDRDLSVTDGARVTANIETNVLGNGTDAYDLLYTYSTDGLFYWPIPNEVSLLENQGPGEIDGQMIQLQMPKVMQDTHFYIRLNARTTGHTKWDVFDVCDFQVNVIEPLTSIESFTTDAAEYVLSDTDVITLNATANADARYKFFYRKYNTGTWVRIPQDQVVGGQATFRPDTEGHYDFKVAASAIGRKLSNPDVVAETTTSVSVWFNAQSVDFLNLNLKDQQRDFVIGTDTEIPLEIYMYTKGTDVEYKLIYSLNGGLTYSQLTSWQTLTTTVTGPGTYDVVCDAPEVLTKSRCLIKVKTRSIGRSGVDETSRPVEIWMLTEQRKIQTSINLGYEPKEYSDTITASIDLTNPETGDRYSESDKLEYKLKYSKDGVTWYKLGAHNWKVFDGDGTAPLDVDLDLSEINGDALVYIKLFARERGSLIIQDYDVDSLEIYNIMPVDDVLASVSLTGDEYATITATAYDDGVHHHTPEFKYSYAMDGESEPQWKMFVSWTTADEVVFSPTISGDYIFKVDARSKGRLTVDSYSTAEGSYEDGYYIKSIEDSALFGGPIKDALASTPEPSPSVTPSASPSPFASEAPVASPSAAPEAVLSSLDFAIASVLGETADMDCYTNVEVLTEDLVRVLIVPDAPVVIVQLSEDTYAVITGFEVDENDVLISLTLSDADGVTILGGTEGIINAWYFVPVEIEAEPSAVPSAAIEPDASAEPNATGTPEPSNNSASEASASPSAE